MEVVTIRPSSGGNVSLVGIQRDPPTIAGGVVIGDSELAIALGKKLAGRPPVSSESCVCLCLCYY